MSNFFSRFDIGLIFYICMGTFSLYFSINMKSKFFLVFGKYNAINMFKLWNFFAKYLMLKSELLSHFGMRRCLMCTLYFMGWSTFCNLSKEQRN